MGNGIMNLAVEKAAWTDSKGYAQDIKDRFTEYVNADSELSEHRSYIEQHAYGMGERCFHWLWKLIVDYMPPSFSFLEVGVYKGQVLSLVGLLAKREGKLADITGVTMLSKFSGTGEFPEFPDEDYAKYIKDLHNRYGLEQPRLIVGDSTHLETQQPAAKMEYDIVYVDACHEYEFVRNDLLFYPTLVKRGGLLVVDDASNYLEQPWGFFQGIEPVSRAVKTIIETDPQWEHLLAVVHNRVWRKSLWTF